MPVPKRKLSRSRRDMRSANKHLTPQSFSLCPQEKCGAPLLPHRVCFKCGFYKSKQVVKIAISSNNMDVKENKTSVQ